MENTWAETNRPRVAGAEKRQPRLFPVTFFRLRFRNLMEPAKQGSQKQVSNNEHCEYAIPY